MTEPNYKQLAEKFYSVSKSYPYTQTQEMLNVMAEYEEATLPALNLIENKIQLDIFEYDNKFYTRLWGMWYEIYESTLILLPETEFTLSLHKAYTKYIIQRCNDTSSTVT